VSTATVDWSHVASDLLALMRGRLFMTVTEGAKILDVDPRTLRRAIESGGCPHVRISGTVRIPVGPFLRWAGIDLEDSEAAPDQRGIRSDLRPVKAIPHGNSHPVAG
jgi:excisionase family DNA binding protein